LQRIIYILIITFGTLFNGFGQTATIKIERLYSEDSFEKFDSLYFDFNGTTFWGSDTLPKTVAVNDNFDQCTVIGGNDTLHFLTKFQSGQEYALRPGCCCAAFTLQSIQNPNRGTVTFKNKTNRDLGLVVCEHNSDTVKIDSIQTTYADESAMCLFKPCKIQIVETTYFSDEYEYKNDDRSYFKLWLEREGYILNQIWFHFLHGEKIEIDFDPKSKNIELKIIGQLTKDELDELWK
jgi:hypothetical protein